MARKEPPDPMALHGVISPVDGRMWDANRREWVTPTAEARPAPGDPTANAAWGHVTTLATIPGHTITETLGVVSVLTAASGWTAGVKGNDALEKAQAQLLIQAHARGANAIVGLTCSTFGAGGGITSVFGGDAVGVMLMGTAVVVSADDRPDE